MDGGKIENVTDYASGDGRFAISRNYRSRIVEVVPGLFLPGPLYILVNNAPVGGAVGGWRFNFQMELHIDGPLGWYSTIHLPDGVSFDFVRSGNTFSPWTGGNPQSRYSVQYDGTPPASWTDIGRATSQWKIVDEEEKRVWTMKTFPKILGTNDANLYSVARPIQMSMPGGYVWNFNYDANGTLQSIVDSNGRTFGVTWNYFVFPPPQVVPWPPLPVSIKEITLPGGGKLRYTYDPPLKTDGTSPVGVERLIKSEQVDSAGTILDSTIYHYENAQYPDILTGITDARGVRLATYAYDGLGRAISSERAGGQEKYTVAYSLSTTTTPNYLVRTVTNPLGKVAKYNFSTPSTPYAASPYQVRLSNIDGQPSTNCPASARNYTYDANGWVASETDEEGRVTAYVRDAATNRPTSITRGSGTANAVTTTLTWNSPYDIPTQTVEPGLTTNVTVGATGLITQIQKVDTTTQTVPYSTNGQTRTTTYGYNATGQLTSVNGPLAGNGDRTLYAYVTTGANKGNLQTITNEMGRVTTVTAWNSRGQPTSITDPNGIVTTLVYEPARGLLKQMNVDTAGTPATTTIDYDAVGQITKITLPNGAFENYTYDNARRLTNVTNSAGETIDYVRNANSDATSVTLKKSGATVASYSKTRAYDELGRLIKLIGADGATKPYKYGYDKSDNLTQITDPRSNVFSYGFDPLNRLITETDEDAKTVTLTRNGIDEITTYNDARNLNTIYIRNGFGEVIREVSPDRGTTTYWRDARGLVTQRTDARGVITNYVYDNAGRLTNVGYAGQTTYWKSYSFDQTAPGNYGIGRLVGVNSDAGVDWRVFDQKGRIATDYRTNNPAPALAVQYSYDAAGNVTQMIYPSGRRVNYARDGMGRVTGVTTQQNAAAAMQTVVSGVTWNPYGPLASMTFGYGGVAAFTTDTDYRITRYQVGTGANPDVVLDRSLIWTGDIVTRITDNKNPGTTPPGSYGAQTQNFTYTPTRRLASASGYYGVLSWLYDANGNRTRETLGGVVSTYAYPATSNRLTSVTPAGGTARSLAYDAAGNILTDSRAGGLGMTFEYDTEGRLKRAFQTNATANGGAYAYDGFNRLASRTVTKTTAPLSVTTLYVHDTSDHIIAETNTAGATLREYIWLNDIPIAVVDNVNTASPTLYYVHTDHLGRPARMVAQNWSWVWDVIYAPFGAVSAVWDATTKLDARFPGQWFQLESGLAYNWHRHYDASLGRYAQPDPLRVDEREGETIGGVTASVLQQQASLVDQIYFRSGVSRFGALEGLTSASSPARSILPDGPSIYGYSTQNPLAKIDPKGLLTSYPFSPRPSPAQKCGEIIRICVGLPGNAAILPGSGALCEYNCGPYRINKMPDPVDGCAGFVQF